MFEARVLLDSVSPAGVRLITLELKYPAMIHGEFMTHRVFSRNAQSTRAIPVEKMLERILQEPAMPIHWGKNQKGMRADEELSTAQQEKAKAIWLEALQRTVDNVRQLQALGVHKQIANRLLQPWMHMVTIVTSTEWDNFFALRIHPEAQPEIQQLARLMRKAIDDSTPSRVPRGDWHLPLIREEDRARYSVDDLKRISVGRCARVSYLTHEGRRDPAEDIRLYNDLLGNGHMSPFEHVATPLEDGNETSGNFRGWQQHRKEIPGEHNFALLN